jgi:hypothetical protein
MIRVKTFEFEGVSLKFASMSVAEAEAFVEDGKKLLERKDVTAQEWLERRHSAILASLSKPVENAAEVWTVDRIKNEFDNPTLDELYRAILKFSGLNPGETPAAAASATSAAA